LSAAADALPFKGFIDGLPIDTLLFAPLVQVGATGNEGGADHVIQVIAAGYLDGESAPDSVFHMVNNTPNQVYGNKPDDWLVVALRDALKVRRVSMRHLSEKLDIPYRSIQNYVSGESRIPGDVLLRICAEIGLEPQHLLTGSFEISHSDLYDSVHHVFGDLLPLIDVDSGGRIILRETPSKDRSEELTVAHILTRRINEAYARYRNASFKGQSSKPRTSSETVNRRGQFKNK
jgi:hypothetical protein